MKKQSRIVWNGIVGGILTKPAGEAGRSRLFRLSALLTPLILGILLISPSNVHAASKTSAGTGAWNTPGTWSPSGVPAAGDDVTIAATHVVTVDVNTNSLNSLTVNGTLTVGNSGTARTVTVTGNVSVSSTGTLQPGTNNANHVMIIGGNLSNAGTFDADVGGRNINVTFNGAANQSVTGNGATTDFNAITINNTGSAGNNIVEISSTNLTTSTAGFVTITNGVLKLSGTYTLSNVLFSTAAYTISATEGIWLNNPNVTVTAQGSDVTIDGLFRVSAGTYNIGTGNNDDLLYGTGSTIDIQGGALNVAGGIRGIAVTDTTTYSQSGGTVTVITQGSSGGTFGAFDIRAAGSSFTMSGGSIIYHNATATADDYIVGATTNNVTGGTVQFGESTSGAGQLYFINSSAPVFNLTVFTTNSPNVRLVTNALTVKGNVNIQTNGTLDAATNNLNMTVTGNWTNNGTFSPGTATVTLNGTSTQTIGGASTTFNNLTINSGATAQLSVGASPVINTTITINGTIVMPNTVTVTSDGSATVTLGSSGLIQTADADGVTGSATTSFGTGFTTTSIDTNGTVEYNLAGAQAVTSRTYQNLTTSGSGTKTLGGAVTVNATLTIGSGTTIADGGATLTEKGNVANSGTHSGAGKISLSGGSAAHTLSGNGTYGNLELNDSLGATLTGSPTVTGALTLTSGDISTGTNVLTQSGTSAGTGDVVGNTKRTDLTVGNTRAFGNPDVRITITSESVPLGTTNIVVSLTKSAPGSFSTAIKRTYNVTRTGAGTFVATMRLQYVNADLNGNTAGSLKMWRLSGSTWSSQGGSDTANDFVELAGITGFSPWTLSSQINAPTDVALIGLKTTRYATGVLLDWQTGYEVSNIGFNIYRQLKGTYSRVTPEPVAGSALLFGPNVALRAGFSYSWFDTDADPDNSIYWLEDIDLSGRSTMHGPFFVSKAVDRSSTPIKSSSVSLGVLGSALSEKISPEIATVPVVPKARSIKPSVASLAVQASIASKPAVKLSVKSSGWYRVSQSDLLAAGFPADADPLSIQLFADSEQVPIVVTSSSASKPQKPSLGSWDGIEFFGVAIDSPFTDSHIYWLVAGSQPGLRISQAPSSPSPADPFSFCFSVERRDKLVYFSSLKNGGAEKFFGPAIFNAQPVSQSIDIHHVASSGPDALLEVSLQGFTDSLHNVSVSFNGSSLGFVQYSGQSKGVAQFSVPLASIGDGINSVQLVGPAGFSDMSLVDYVRLSFQHSSSADSNSLYFSADSGQQASISGFSSSSVRVFDVTDPSAPVEVIPSVSQDGSSFLATITVPGVGTRSLFALGADQTKSPSSVVPNSPSSLASPANAADYIAVTRKDLISSVLPLVAQRRAQGLKCSLVDIEDVYDEFNFGNKSPQALKDFFSFTKSSWKRAPRFVSLVGDATFDPKNYMGLGDFDIVPTKLVETAFNETATDDWFVDVDNDGIPDIAIGRLPVRTPSEAFDLVSKVVNYDRSEFIPKAVLVADHNDAFDFEAADSDLKSALPPSLDVTDIRRGQVGDSSARSMLIDSINRGAKIVNYYGHGSIQVWSNASVLTASDAAGLTNYKRLALFDSMTCLTGFFHDVSNQSLGEALLKSSGGAIAVWASTGMTDPSAQVVMNQQAIQLLFNNPGLTIGEIAAQSKAATTNPDVRRTWVLLGDPATRIK